METTNTITESPDKGDDTPPNTSAIDQPLSTPPLSKRKFDKMKDAAFPTIPVYPSKVSPKDALSFQRDEHLLPLL